jgi:hypothetical protein
MLLKCANINSKWAGYGLCSAGDIQRTGVGVSG